MTAAARLFLELESLEKVQKSVWCLNRIFTVGSKVKKKKDKDKDFRLIPRRSGG